MTGAMFKTSDMKKVWYYIKIVAAWIGKRLKNNYAAEWTVIALGGWLIFTQSRLLGIIIALLGIIYLVNEIYENSKGNEVAE
jgi:hypothetical protein